MRSPILLFMTSRSRSSMIAGVFAAHGVNWGGVQAQSAGYDTFENQAVKQVLKKHYGLPFCEFAKASGDFLLDLWPIVPQNETWMAKTGIEYFDVFQSLAPFNIYLTRDPEDVARSICQKRPDAQYEPALKAAKWRFAAMRARAAEYGGVFIDTDRVVKGDFTQLREAMEYCGVLFEENKAKAVIKR